MSRHCPFAYATFLNESTFVSATALIDEDIIPVSGITNPSKNVCDSRAGNSEKIAAHTRAYEDRFLSPFVAAERGYIDEVIMPHSTRRRVARALRLLRNKDLQNPWKKHDNIPL